MALDYQRITVFLIGNATHDGEVKQGQENDTTFGDFRLAVRDRNGETHYYPIRCFGRLAESVVHIKRGKRLFVDGDLEISGFTTDTGERQMTFRVVANTYRILDAGRRLDGAEASVPSSTGLDEDDLDL